MINSINTFLMPLENFIKRYRKYMGYAIIMISFFAGFFLFDVKLVKSSGEKAITLLWVILWMPILARVFGLRIFAQLLPLRKELGILMGVLALVHGFSFMSANQAFMQSGTALWSDGGPTFLFFGVIAMWLSLPLTLTSSTWAMRKLGRHWKTLHRLVYAVLIFAVVHVILIKAMKHFDPAPLIMLGFYFIGKILEWKGFSFQKK